MGVISSTNLEKNTLNIVLIYTRATTRLYVVAYYSQLNDTVIIVDICISYRYGRCMNISNFNSIYIIVLCD